MPTVDRLGRRHHPDQHRGLRSLFPTLPVDCQSRLIRVAMSATAWARLDELVAGAQAPTPPRAIGAFIEAWLSAESARTHVSMARSITVTAPPVEEQSSDWQDWQMRKELALLASVRSALASDQPTVH